MSSSSPEDDDEDCVVAIKFLGPQLNDVFLIPGAGGHIIASWDHHNQSSKNPPKLQSLLMMYDGTARLRTEALMVFKLDDERNAVYTQDIGDLCIFLTRSEPFCLPSSFSLTLCRPNCVKIMDLDENKIFKLSDQNWNCSRWQAPVEYVRYASTWYWA
ncbi:unnamed protein product [Brassica oleracea var. botrytis]|uniref:DUF295 domain-containing protein n=2 Tax=Brassica TaxID=3705 RepID=A0A3P6DLE8_BRAOL|nr:unnamed protein product [Brassica napus]CDY28625.1 BnaC09g32500D [Brassica napus]VDD32217.1 unnamed protein product [Brassica oleracea]